MISPAIIGAILTIVFMALSILIGLAYRDLKRRIRELEEENDVAHDSRVSLTEKVDTLWRWAFGREDDETDGGLAQEIQNGFSQIEEDICELEDKQQIYHEAEMATLERIANELHDEEDVDIDREDILED